LLLGRLQDVFHFRLNLKCRLFDQRELFALFSRHADDSPGFLVVIDLLDVVIQDADHLGVDKLPTV
jgi:hypothetical protein